MEQELIQAGYLPTRSERGKNDADEKNDKPATTVSAPTAVLAGAPVRDLGFVE
jgi:hypothetical protein